MDVDGLHDEWRARALAVAEIDDAIDSPDLAACMAFVDARLAIHTGRFDTARTLVDRAFATFTAPRTPRMRAPWLWEGYAPHADAELAVAAGRGFSPPLRHHAGDQ